MKRIKRPSARLRGLSGDTRGFSLVELIVSVTILALITAPLLHTFLVAASTSRRAQDMGNATLAAQNLTESLLGTSVTDLLDAAPLGAPIYYEGNFSGELTKLSAKPTKEDESYHIALANYNAPGTAQRFDALLSFDAGASIDTGVGVTQYTQMDAVFVQPSDASNPDTSMELDLQTEALRYVSDNYDLDGMLTPTSPVWRKLTIQIVQDPDRRNITASATFTYRRNYSFQYWEYEDDDENGNPIRTGTLTGDPGDEDGAHGFPISTTIDFYSRHYAQGADFTALLDNLFIFYYPWYNTIDEIVIENNIGKYAGVFKAPLSFDIFLVKQKPAGLLSEDNYNANVNVKQNQTPIHTAPILRTNLYYNLCASEPNTYIPGFSASSTYIVTLGFARVPVLYPQDGLLKVDYQSKRIYNVTLRLYPSGSLTGGDSIQPSDLGSPLVTLNSTKLID